MPHQYGLFNCSPPHVATETSRDGAGAIREDVPTLRRQVLGMIEARGIHGATDEEMQAGLKMNPSTQRPRRRELVLLGRICDSGDRRKTLSGRNAIVWIVKAQGRVE